MKKLALISTLFLALVLAVSSAWAAENVLLDSVDLGTGGTEAGRIMSGWGRSATDETGGNYGGIGLGGCRLVWDVAPDTGRDATIELSSDRGAAMNLSVQHLDGLADDSFDVDVLAADGTWTSVGHYTGLTTGTEDWKTTDFDLSWVEFGRGRDPLVFRFTATGDQWTGFPTWGQLCIDWIELYGNGAPR